MRLGLLLPAFAFGLVLASGCLERETVTTQDIVASIPWPDQERAEYVLLDRDGEERGQGVLSVTRQGDQFELFLGFEGGGETDESVVLVDAATLKPIFVRRELHGDENKAFEAQYDTVEKVVRVVEIEDSDERTVPRRLDKEHYYDNESSLFLWRTIDFQEGYKATYYSVLSNQGGTQHTVSLRVAGKERVAVPAGVFQAWRLEIRFGDRRQVAWYADTPERPLVQYDNDFNSILQLTALE